MKGLSLNEGKNLTSADWYADHQIRTWRVIMLFDLFAAGTEGNAFLFCTGCPLVYSKPYEKHFYQCMAASCGDSDRGSVRTVVYTRKDVYC